MESLSGLGAPSYIACHWRLRGAPEVANNPNTVNPDGLPLSTIPAWVAHRVPGNCCSHANHPDRGDHYHQYLEYVGHSGLPVGSPDRFSGDFFEWIYPACTSMEWVDIRVTRYQARSGAGRLSSNKNGGPKAAVGVSFEKEIPWREFLFNTTVKL